MHILLVEDEPKIREVVIAYLEKEGWVVTYTSNGLEAVQLFDRSEYDLVILDLMLEGLPGEEVCQQIREKSNVPLIMLTSKNREQDTIRGLRLGADDYIVKPFRVKELVARIHALMRRITPPREQVAAELFFNEKRLYVNIETKMVRSDRNEVNLTGTEFKLLTVLMEVPGKIFNRNELMYKVSGYRFAGDSRVIDTHIKNLRKKIEPDFHQPIYIITYVGEGYKFAYQPDEHEEPQ